VAETKKTKKQKTNKVGTWGASLNWLVSPARKKALEPISEMTFLKEAPVWDLAHAVGCLLG
jgi:hypothetical protein